jgi:pimeloyl-ACP methyl ester carboxylesterase
MKLQLFTGALSLLVLAGCSAPVATVTEVIPERRGFAAAGADPFAALEGYVGAAESAWHRLEEDPANAEAQRDYNFALSRIFGTLREAKLKPWKEPIKLGAHTLSWKADADPERNPDLYELIPSDQLVISGPYLERREVKDGLGAPLVAKRVADQVDQYAPTPYFYYDVTAVARFEGSRCVLALEYPLKAETTSIAGHTFPLAADYTAPLALMLVEMQPEKLGIPRLLHPAEFADTTRISRLEPYDPDKTVVLVVHGLMSSPATWFPLLNELRANPELRQDYQFWFFSYPSGYPYPYTAALLRHELDQAEKHYPLSKKMVVIGHSMGGCISRLLITDSGRRIWDQLFNVPPERMDLKPEHKQLLTESTIFTHRKEIGRVIFIASPLRGADTAGGWIGRLASRLVQLPADMASIGAEEVRYDKEANAPDYLDRFPDSVDTLSPEDIFVRALNTVPLTPGIPHHTIAGDRGRGDAPNSSDGVVPYWSSHLPSAESEKIVPSDHNAQQNAQAIEEVARILKVHSAEPN